MHDSYFLPLHDIAVGVNSRGQICVRVRVTEAVGRLPAMYLSFNMSYKQQATTDTVRRYDNKIPFRMVVWYKDDTWYIQLYVVLYAVH